VRAVVAKLKKSSVAKKAAQKTQPKKTTLKVAARKAPLRKPVAKKLVAEKRAPTKKNPAKKGVAKKGVAKKAPGRPFPSKAALTPVVPMVTTVSSVTEERRLVMPPPLRPVKSGKKSAPLKPIKVAPTPVVVSESETPWSASELKAIRSELAKDLVRLKAELAAVEIEMNALIRESGEGAGDDQVDAGTKTFEREHEMSLVINARDMVLQTERALARIDEKTYGRCEECGNSIGKARLHVFPRATLCMVCKQKEERR
jgi:DnaK suppressor protein